MHCRHGPAAAQTGSAHPQGQGEAKAGSSTSSSGEGGGGPGVSVSWEAAPLFCPACTVTEEPGLAQALLPCAPMSRRVAAQCCPWLEADEDLFVFIGTIRVFIASCFHSFPRSGRRTL